MGKHNREELTEIEILRIRELYQMYKSVVRVCTLSGHSKTTVMKYALGRNYYSERKEKKSTDYFSWADYPDNCLIPNYHNGI